ncbi:MAG: hypothetical protein R3B54_03535 [Bdellovibrionota bacterium]
MVRAFLDGGFELRYACGQLGRQLARRAADRDLPRTPAALFDGSDFPPHLRDALGVVEALYKEGHPVRSVLGQLSDLLMREHEAAVEAFSQTLRARLGGATLFLFLPPALLLLLAPLCLALSRF